MVSFVNFNGTLNNVIRAIIEIVALDRVIRAGFIYFHIAPFLTRKTRKHERYEGHEKHEKIRGFLTLSPFRVPFRALRVSTSPVPTSMPQPPDRPDLRQIRQTGPVPAGPAWAQG